MSMFKTFALCLLLLLTFFPTVLAENRTCLYFFYGITCPHCARERPFLKQLEERYPGLEVHEFEVYYNKENRELWKRISEKYGTQPSGVPMTFIGDFVFIGYSEGDAEIYDKNYKAYIGYSDLIEKTVNRYVRAGGVDCPDELKNINFTQPNGSLSGSIPLSSPHPIPYIYLIPIILLMVFILMKFKISIKVGGERK